MLSAGREGAPGMGYSFNGGRGGERKSPPVLKIIWREEAVRKSCKGPQRLGHDS